MPHRAVGSSVFSFRLGSTVTILALQPEQDSSEGDQSQVVGGASLSHC